MHSWYCVLKYSTGIEANKKILLPRVSAAQTLHVWYEAGSERMSAGNYG
jgi:hypothetical protein